MTSGATPNLSKWKLEGATHINKAFIDADSAPGVATWGVTLSAKVRPSACNWCYWTQFIAKPKAACVLHFSWAATSSNFGL